MKRFFLFTFLSLFHFHTQSWGKAEPFFPMGMRVESIENKNGILEVVTTGARFEFKEEGSLVCYQRIPTERKVATFYFPPALFPMKPLAEEVGGNLRFWKDPGGFDAVVWGRGASLKFSGDSVVIFQYQKQPEAEKVEKPSKWDRALTRVLSFFNSHYERDLRIKKQLEKERISVEYVGHFAPEYHAEKDGNWLFADPVGGFGVYPAREIASTPPKLDARDWRLGYQLRESDELWLSVFPPRPYNRERAKAQISHEGWREPLSEAYPPNSVIQENAKFTKVFAVHSYIWPGGDKAPWYISDFLPTNRPEYDRVEKEVHRNGMKLVAYFSPFYAAVPDFFFQVKRALSTLKLDGLYYDGTAMDFRKMYALIRQTREILGNDRILYLHNSADPFNSSTVFAPFIDTYADYLLRGETGAAGMDLGKFLRYVVSSYNMGNSVGVWIYYAATVDDKNPKYKHVPPPIEHIELALKNHAFLWLNNQLWRFFNGPKPVESFFRDYYPRVEKLKHPD